MKKSLLGLSLLLLPWISQAQIFMCKDASGKTISSDRPIPECASAIREFGTSGQILRTIPPPLTAEQKQQKRLDEEKRKVDEAAAAEQKRQDQAMLARYSNEFEINSARKRALEQLQEQKKRTATTLADSEKQLTAGQAELTAFDKNNKNKQLKTPQGLARKIESSEAAIRDGKKALEEQESQIVQINTKFDETLKRFNELTAPAPAAAK